MGELEICSMGLPLQVKKWIEKQIYSPGLLPEGRREMEIYNVRLPLHGKGRLTKTLSYFDR
jgi:hypothetical protein